MNSLKRLLNKIFNGELVIERSTGFYQIKMITAHSIFEVKEIENHTHTQKDDYDQKNKEIIDKSQEILHISVFVTNDRSDVSVAPI